MIETYSASNFFETPDFHLWIGSLELHQPDIGLHRHEFWELAIILGGDGYHCVENEEYTLEAGDVFVINRELAHGFRDSTGLRVCNILFDPEQVLAARAEMLRLPGYHALFVFEPYYRKTHRFQSRLHLTTDELRDVRDLIEPMEDEQQRSEPGYQSIMLARFQMLVVYLSRAFSRPTSSAGHRVLRLSKVVSYLESNYRDPIRLDDLLVIARMSKNHFLRVFKQCYGTSPNDYLIRLRLAKACELMERSNKGISEIAFEVGFHDSNYFSRQFRQVYGHSPRTFRRRLPGAD